jgi:hypothetical protein
MDSEDRSLKCFSGNEEIANLNFQLISGTSYYRPNLTFRDYLLNYSRLSSNGITFSNNNRDGFQVVVTQNDLLVYLDYNRLPTSRNNAEYGGLYRDGEFLKIKIP